MELRLERYLLVTEYYEGQEQDADGDAGDQSQPMTRLGGGDPDESRHAKNSRCRQQANQAGRNEFGAWLHG